MQLIGVFVVDDHPLARSGIRALLETEVDINVVGEADSGEEAIKMVLSIKPDVTLMDVSLTGISGVEATVEIKKAAPSLRIILISTFSNVVNREVAQKAGASGFLLKTSLRGRLLSAIRQVHQGNTVFLFAD